jgi:elongation factor G
MKTYLTKDIRNVGIVGHGGTGKTQLVSSLLYTAGMTPRWGKVADGTATTDFDEEEIARKISYANRPRLRRVALHIMRGLQREK